jgi:hypothetical protein
LPRFDTTTGKLIQGSSVFINDSDVAFMPAATATKVITVAQSASPSVNMSSGDLFVYDSLTPSLVWTKTADFSSNTTGTLTFPSGAQQGDYVVLYVASDGSAPTMTSTGWTLLQSGNPSTHPFACWQKQMGATPDTDVTVGGISTASAAIARAYRGTTGAGASAGTSSTTGMPDAPTVTPTANGSIVIAFGSLDDDAGITSSAPATYGNYAAIESSASKVTLYSADKFNVSTSENPAAFAGGGSDEWGAVTVSMSPATKGTFSFTSTPTQSVGAYGTVDGSVKIFHIKGTIGVHFPASVSYIGGTPSAFPILATLVTSDGGATWVCTYAS